jgi:glycosyltransferase involved in cell wall biosynthesis
VASGPSDERRSGAETVEKPPIRLTAIVPATNRPETLSRCLEGIRIAVDPPEEIVVIEEPPGSGPAHARNLGARDASGEVLVFVDADVVVHKDVFVRIRRAFADDPGLAALFGSYDDAPEAPGIVAGFRNLLHHDVHQASPGAASTFWAGLGAMRRDVFFDSGGFDSTRFRAPSVEDVELGARLARRGARIELDPELLGTHLKGWTLLEMVRTDFASRGVPWVSLLLDGEVSSAVLNLGWRHRLSALASVVGALALIRRKPVTAGLAAASLIVLNRSFYRLLLSRRGPLHASVGIGLHAVHHLTAAAAVPAAVGLRALRGARPTESSARQPERQPPTR